MIDLFLYIFSFRIKTLLIQILLITKEIQVWSMRRSQASMSVYWSYWNISGLCFDYLTYRLIHSIIKLWATTRLVLSEPMKEISKWMLSMRLDFQHWWKQQYKVISTAFQHCLNMAPMMLSKTVVKAFVLKDGLSTVIVTRSLFNFHNFLVSRFDDPNQRKNGWRPMILEWKKYWDKNNPFNPKSSSINIKIWWIWCH